MKFPVYNAASRKGEDGFTIVKRIVERDLNWILRKNHQENDFGIDAYIDLVSEVGQVTGKSIALQLKTGKSYFEEANELGWIYRGDLKHLNYYLNHEIPVILVIVDDRTDRAYWCLCDPSKTERSGSNWKITVPFNQELGTAAKDELSQHISPIVDYASQLEDFWEENKVLKELARIVFVVAREDVETCEYLALLLGIKRLEVNPDLLMACKGKVDILIGGYNDDPRELRDIPEVKKWVEAVFGGVDGWVYYLVMDNGTQFLRLLQCFNMKYEIFDDPSKQNRERYRIEFDLASGEPFLHALYGDLNQFCEKHRISEEIIKERSFKLIEFLTGKELPADLKAN